MRAAVISGGELEDDFVLAALERIKADRIIAADRGLSFCSRNHLMPDYIVGDFDSEPPDSLAFYREQGGIPIDLYDPVKDMTDTDIALEKAVSIGAGEVFFFGATGSRLDHTLSNIRNLYLLYSRGIEGVIWDAHNRIRMPVGRRISLEAADSFGDHISLFSFLGDVEGLTLEGFAYPLKGALLGQVDGGLGVSNYLTAERGDIYWDRGILILMETRD